MNATFTLMLTVLYYNGPGWRSRYSDSLRAGWSGDRIPVGARFSAPVQTGPGAHLASCTMGTGSFAGVKRPGRGADLPPTIQVPRSRKSGAIPLLPLWAFMACYGSTLLYCNMCTVIDRVRGTDGIIRKKI